jgi:hypothetical protein
MTPYTIDRTANLRRTLVAEWLDGLDLVSPDLRDMIVTAWVSSWSSSPYENLSDMPFAPVADYPLERHVNEVTRAGLDLARRAATDWGTPIDNDILVPILILHDVDKPLMYVRESGTVGYSQLSRELPHGVVGAMLLKELGFSHPVVSAVATHAGYSPFHAETFEGYVLHYADYFAADHAMRVCNKPPFYQKRHG